MPGQNTTLGRIEIWIFCLFYRITSNWGNDRYPENRMFRSLIVRCVRPLPFGDRVISAGRTLLGLGESETQNHWARIVMNRETRKLVDALAPNKLEVLEVSGTTWNIEGYFKDYTFTSYPMYDVCAQPLERSFDLIIAEQVFEHLLWPYRAGKHVYQMLRPGGHFLITTPFMIRIHTIPRDCTRWSETGLQYFLAECGFELSRIRTQSWGNRACVKANFLGWQIYQSWRHSLVNEANFPVVVWALAQK
jgi:SAM-dependent methyltransferase